jgi:phosphoglycerate-specific signal transduction histidine kinase
MMLKTARATHARISSSNQGNGGMGRLMQRAVPLKNPPTVANPTLAALLHELNQPLTAILSNAQAAQRCLSDSLAPGSSGLLELQEILADIVADDKKAAAIIKRLTQAIKDAEDE